MYDNTTRVIEVDINEVLPNRFQPRIQFDEEEILELSDSIKEHGVIQPLVVRTIGDKFEIIAGERRYKASVLAGKDTVPVIIKNLNDKDSAEIALIENIQRKNLTPIEEALSYKKILDMGYITQEKLASKLGKSQSSVANKIRLLNLSDEVQDALLENKISERHARSLLKLSNESQQNEMLERIISERLTVRRTDEEIEKVKNNQDYSNNIKEEKIEEGNGEFEMNNESIITPNFDIFSSQVPAAPVAAVPVMPAAPVAAVPEVPVMPAAPAAAPEVPVMPAAPAAAPEVPVMPAAPAAAPEVPVMPAAPAAAPEVPVMPAAPVAVAPEVPVMPAAPAAVPEVPVMPAAPVAVAPEVPVMPAAPAAVPEVPVMPAAPVAMAPEVPAMPTALGGIQFDANGNVISMPSAPEVPVMPSAPEVPAMPAALGGIQFDAEGNVISMPSAEIEVPQTNPIVESPIQPSETQMTQQAENLFSFGAAPVVATPVVPETPAAPVAPAVMPEPIIVTDYSKQYDPVMPQQVTVQAPTIDFKQVINMIRECSKQIEQYGFKIDVEEYDLANLYQVVFKIEK